MKLIFDKSVGGMILVAITGKQSGKCSTCGKKLTQKNLGMIYKNDGETCLCCNSILCFLEIRDILDKLDEKEQSND